MSSKDNDEEPVMHSKCDSIEIMINDKTHGVIEKRFQSLIWRWYQIGWCFEPNERKWFGTWLCSFITLWMPQNNF